MIKRVEDVGRTLPPPPAVPSKLAFLLLPPADARRFSLSFFSGPSSSFSIVRTNVSMRRLSLIRPHSVRKEALYTIAIDAHAGFRAATV